MKSEQVKNSNIETCPDNHHCLNGSKCTQNPYDEGAYYCDCDETIFETRYEGLYCEHKAERYCIAQGVHQHSFCTNGGTCIDYVGPEEAHLGCDCPSDFEGSHCQFVKGTKPDGWPFTAEKVNGPNGSSSTSSGSDAGEIAAVVIGLLTVVVLIMAVLYKRVNTSIEACSGADEYHCASGRDLELNPDGEMLKEVMVNGNSSSKGNSPLPSIL